MFKQIKQKLNEMSYGDKVFHIGSILIPVILILIVASAYLER